MITIRHPLAINDERNSVPHEFVAVGTAPLYVKDAHGEDVQVEDVRGEITRVDGSSARPIQGKKLFFVKRDGMNRWMMHFTVHPDKAGYFRLDVVGLDELGDDIAGTAASLASFYVRETFLPLAFAGDEVKDASKIVKPLANYMLSFGYPNSPLYQLSYEEKSHFVTYGNHTHLVLSAVAGSQLPDYVYDNISMNFWAAEFTNLGNLNGDLDLVVTNVENHVGPSVTIRPVP